MTLGRKHHVAWSDGLAKNISLFSGYSQAENRTTNYCLLILKLLYEENPKLLGEAIASLAGDEIGEVVGWSFDNRRGAHTAHRMA